MKSDLVFSDLVFSLYLPRTYLRLATNLGCISFRCRGTNHHKFSGLTQNMSYQGKDVSQGHYSILYAALGTIDIFTGFGCFQFPLSKLPFLGPPSFLPDEILIFSLLVAVNFYIWKMCYDFWSYFLFPSLWLALTFFFPPLALSLNFQENLGPCYPGPDIQVPRPPYSRCCSPYTWGTTPSLLVRPLRSRSRSPSRSWQLLCAEQSTQSTCPSSFPGSGDCLFSVSPVLSSPSQG